jgi:hypothetical protein
MVEDFESIGAEERLRVLGRRVGERLAFPIDSADVYPLVDRLANEIAELLHVRSGRPATGRWRPAHNENPLYGPEAVGLFGSVVRTVNFARETNLGGVPTLIPFTSDDQPDGDTEVTTIIDVFDEIALERIHRDAVTKVGPWPHEATDGSARLADWLKMALAGHPWARLSEYEPTVRDLGINFNLHLAGNVLARAAGASTTINYSVNTINSGLVLDVFPELTYVPRRFGSKVSTPVDGNLTTGWWKFETVTGGSLVRDRGRHRADTSTTSTITSDF